MYLPYRASKQLPCIINFFTGTSNCFYSFAFKFRLSIVNYFNSLILEPEAFKTLPLFVPKYKKESFAIVDTTYYRLELV